MLLVAVILAVALVVNGHSLTTVMEPHEKDHCFYIIPEDTKGYLDFYYSEAVTKLSRNSGAAGSAPVKLQVFGPSMELLQDHPPKAVLSTKVTDLRSGQYAFCLSYAGNERRDRKVLDIDLSEHESTASGGQGIPKDDPDGGNESTLGRRLRGTNQKLNGDLADMLHTLRYIKNREKRNMETVEESNSRVFWFSILECVLVVVIAIVQVATLKHLFGTGSRPRV